MFGLRKSSKDESSASFLSSYNLSVILNSSSSDYFSDSVFSEFSSPSLLDAESVTVSETDEEELLEQTRED